MFKFVRRFLLIELFIMPVLGRNGVTMPVPCSNGVTMTVPGMNGATMPAMVGM